MAAARTETLDFSPDARTLGFVIDELADLGSLGGGAADVATRRAALAQYLRAAALTPPVPRRWRHDYRALGFAGLTWSSGRVPVPALPVYRPRGGEVPSDVPALAVENAGGIVHAGSTYLAPQAARNDPRVTLASLADAFRRDPAAIRAIAGTIVRVADDPFVALATAFENCGAFVDVPAGVALDAPVQLVWSAAPGTASAVFARTVVRVGANARATIVERHVGEGEALVAATVEIELAPGAELAYVVVQQADDGSRLLIRRGARCAAGSRMAWHVAELGGALVRTALDSHLAGAGARATVDLLSFARAFAHADLSVSCAHRAPRTVSETIVRRAATDRAQGRFFGTVAIDGAARRGDASLRDDALVLSRDAFLQSDPRLTIDASDVAARHAATVGSLAEEALFYVQSRGIARGRAQRMMALAFFEPAIANFPGEALRDEVRTALDGRLDEIGDTFAA